MGVVWLDLQIFLEKPEIWISDVKSVDLKIIDGLLRGSAI